MSILNDPKYSGIKNFNSFGERVSIYDPDFYEKALKFERALDSGLIDLSKPLNRGAFPTDEAKKIYYDFIRSRPLDVTKDASDFSRSNLNRPAAGRTQEGNRRLEVELIKQRYKNFDYVKNKDLLGSNVQKLYGVADKTTQLNYDTEQALKRNEYIDLNDPKYAFLSRTLSKKVSENNKKLRRSGMLSTPSPSTQSDRFIGGSETFDPTGGLSTEARTIELGSGSSPSNTGLFSSPLTGNDKDSIDFRKALLAANGLESFQDPNTGQSVTQPIQSEEITGPSLYDLSNLDLSGFDVDQAFKEAQSDVGKVEGRNLSRAQEQEVYDTVLKSLTGAEDINQLTAGRSFNEGETLEFRNYNKFADNPNQILKLTNLGDDKFKYETPYGSETLTKEDLVRKRLISLFMYNSLERNPTASDVDNLLKLTSITKDVQPSYDQFGGDANYSDGQVKRITYVNEDAAKRAAKAYGQDYKFDDKRNIWYIGRDYGSDINFGRALGEGLQNIAEDVANLPLDFLKATTPDFIKDPLSSLNKETVAKLREEIADPIFETVVEDGLGELVKPIGKAVDKAVFQPVGKAIKTGSETIINDFAESNLAAGMTQVAQNFKDNPELFIAGALGLGPVANLLGGSGGAAGGAGGAGGAGMLTQAPSFTPVQSNIELNPYQINPIVLGSAYNMLGKI